MTEVERGLILAVNTKDVLLSWQGATGRMRRHLLGYDKPRETMAEWGRDTSLNRAGTSGGQTGLVALLTGPDAAYLTGGTIDVDGGLIMS
jgi:meso-butanediol dehydrogenase/(S,S)-butanediol dehydrogenase/diacetyl reductase